MERRAPPLSRGFSLVRVTDLTRKLAPYILHSRLVRCESAFELRVLDGSQNFFEARTRRIASVNQIAARNQRSGANGLGRNGMQLLRRILVCAELTVAGEAIEAVQFQMLSEARQPQKLLQRRLLHQLYLAETHVIVDQRQNLIGFVVRKSEPAQDFRSHLHANLNLPVEPYAIRRNPKSRRLAHIVKQ